MWVVPRSIPETKGGDGGVAVVTILVPRALPDDGQSTTCGVKRGVSIANVNQHTPGEASR
jgi:hypothetical protein